MGLAVFCLLVLTRSRYVDALVSCHPLERRRGVCRRHNKRSTELRKLTDIPMTLQITGVGPTDSMSAAARKQEETPVLN